MNYTRRRFLESSSALGAAALLGFSGEVSAEPAPETKTIRIAKHSAACAVPLYVSEILLRVEGFTQIDYIEAGHGSGEPAVGPNKADFDVDCITPVLTYIDARKPVLALAGVHSGCYELFGSERVNSIRELRGKRVPIDQLGNAKHILLSSMAAQAGVDPRSEIEWVVVSADQGRELYEQGKVDAFLAFPPEPQELRAKKFGQVIVDTATDEPWSRLFCCMLVGHAEFVRKHPIATKRAVRAILKAADLCANSPHRAAKLLVKRKLASRYEHALESLRELRFTWRSYDPENSMRFHAARLHEVGMLKTPPNQLIAQGTDWRFLNEIKQELRA